MSARMTTTEPNDLSHNDFFGLDGRIIVVSGCGPGRI